MLRVVAFFNHKGGVGKTTLVLNIGLALAAQGKRVLFVDLDAQANLTSASLPESQLENLLNADGTIHHCLTPIIDGSGAYRSIKPQKIRDSAWLLPGDIRLSDFEEILPQGWTEALAGLPRGFQVSSTIFRLIDEVGTDISADYAFLDLGPNVGSLNRVAMLSANGFVVPLAPDLFSITALPSVGKSAARWIADWSAARGALERAGHTLTYKLPPGSPSPLGYISQQFAVYRQAPAAAYKRWVRRIPGAYADGILGPLSRAGVPIPPGGDAIGEVRNLSSLIPMAQRTHQAVFELSGSEARGAQFTRARDTFKLFEGISERLMKKLDWIEDHGPLGPMSRSFSTQAFFLRKER